MNAIQTLINRCLQEAKTLHMVELMNQAKRADEELKRLQAVEQAARSLIEDCGWNIPVLSQHGEYDIEGHLLMELAAALEGDS